MLDPGARIGGYRISSHLATGGMGEIYKVMHVDRGTTHALKFIALPNARVRKRLLREAALQTRLSHPNVVTLTEVIEHEGDPGLIMELVDGPSLSWWLRERHPTLEEAESLFRGVVAGVSHAHANGMVHRDLKPSNILLSRSPDGLVPKIADFGIAKALEDEGQEKLTRTGHSLGSPAYMAPEQIHDAHHVDQRADIYSLGCLLYELVCGERAFKGDDTLDVLNAVSLGHYVPSEQVAPSVPARFHRVIRACLVRDPARRLPDCAAVLALLDEGGEGDQPEVRRPHRALSEERTEPRIRAAGERTRTIPRIGGRAALEGVAGAVLTVVVLLAALLVGVLGAWLFLG